MRTQIINLCDRHNKQLFSKLNFEFKAGSIDSLLRFVRANQASTLLPYLSIIDFSERQKKLISHFANPVPYRSIGLVVHRHFVKNKILQILKNEIMEKVASVLPDKKITGEKLFPLKPQF